MRLDKGVFLDLETVDCGQLDLGCLADSLACWNWHPNSDPSEILSRIHDADAGRHLLAWGRAAGFSEVTATASVWCFADPESRRWWAGLWADRVLQSSYRTQALERELTDEAELTEIAAGWRAWAEDPDGVFFCPHGEILARG